MAYGQKQVFVASPQPGTSNQPYPIGPLPPFVPVQVTVTNDYAARIEAEALVLSSLIASLMLQLGNGVTPLTIAGVLSGVNDSLASMADRKKEIAKFLSDLNIATGSVATAKSTHGAILSIATANQIETNNFYQAVAPDKPVMKPLDEQFITAIKNGNLIESVSKASATTIGFINDSVAQVGTWITGSSAYKTVAKWISDSIDTIGTQISLSAQSIWAKIKGGL
jgi:hypothetical protein